MGRLLWLCFQWHLCCVDNDIYVYVFLLNIDNKSLRKRIKGLVIPFGIYFAKRILIFFRFLPLQLLGFYFLYSFYTLNNTITLFY